MNWFLTVLEKIFKKNDTKTHMEVKLLTYDQFLAINNGLNPNECKYYIDALEVSLNKYEINTPLRICHFLAQILHESGHLKYKVENLNYSAKALRSVFGKYFKTDDIANEYARKPEKIANRVYANRMGNGDELSGDGWRFRGRGLIQLTGRENYRRCSIDTKLDILNNPDLIINTPEACIETACWFWKTNNLIALADQDNITLITKRINGGTNGLDDRKKILENAKNIIKC